MSVSWPPSRSRRTTFFLLDDAVSSSSACWMRFWKKIKLVSFDDASPSSGKSGRVERNGSLESILYLKDL
ncbi:hypothetical protein Hanom_Chr07g00585491 [Helianthus anomalus]